MKTVYPSELLMKLKVHNVVSDNFYFDQNIVRVLYVITVSDLKNLKLANFFHYFYNFTLCGIWICYSMHSRLSMLRISLFYFFSSR